MPIIKYAHSETFENPTPSLILPPVEKPGDIRIAKSTRTSPKPNTTGNRTSVKARLKEEWETADATRGMRTTAKSLSDLGAAWMKGKV